MMLKKKLLILTLIAVLSMLLSCGEHSDYDISKFKGEYRYYAGIAEFFDCDGRVKYYVADAGVNADLKKAYLKLGLEEKDDVYIQLTGYLKEEKPKVDGIEPSTVFVPVEIIKLDKNRGCQPAIRKGY